MHQSHQGVSQSLQRVNQSPHSVAHPYVMSHHQMAAVSVHPGWCLRCSVQNWGAPQRAASSSHPVGHPRGSVCLCHQCRVNVRTDRPHLTLTTAVTRQWTPISRTPPPVPTLCNPQNQSLNHVQDILCHPHSLSSPQDLPTPHDLPTPQDLPTPHDLPGPQDLPGPYSLPGIWTARQQWCPPYAGTSSRRRCRSAEGTPQNPHGGVSTTRPLH